jgi:drug/metabolite transporter (DMT)-like permease
VKPHTILLAILCQLFLVIGQLFFKRAMKDRPEPLPRSRMLMNLGVGIVAQSFWFFIWINLLEGEKLSRIFPFEGLNPVLIVAASWFLLKERLNWSTAAGVILICGGIFLASGS